MGFQPTVGAKGEKEEKKSQEKEKKVEVQVGSKPCQNDHRS